MESVRDFVPFFLPNDNRCAFSCLKSRHRIRSTNRRRNGRVTRGGLAGLAEKHKKHAHNSRERGNPLAHSFQPWNPMAQRAAGLRLTT